MEAEEQMPGVFPLALMALIVSVRNAQLLVASCPDHEQPELGLVSTSIQMVVQRLLEIPLVSSLTWLVAFFPLQGNMQTSVDRPAARALLRLLLPLGSKTPVERKARIIAKELPAFLRQVNVEAEVGLAMSMPFTDIPCTISMATNRKQCSLFISLYQQSYEIQRIQFCLHLLKLDFNYPAIKAAMSQFGGSSYPQSQFSEPLPARSKFQAEESAMQIIERIIDRAIYRIMKGEKFRQNLKKFSNIKTINNINEVNSLNFYDSQISLSALSPSKQPRPLYVDSLLPISADIDRENAYKLSLKKMISSQLSDISRMRKLSPSKIQKTEKYHRLDFEAQIKDDQDGFTKQLRKVQEQKQSKERNDQKNKDLLAKEQKQKLREKKKEKEQKFSFDYSGIPIKIRSQNKANLISKLVNGNMNAKIQVNKEAFNDPNPQSVDSVVLGKKKNAISVKRKDEIQFQQNRSLSQGVTVGMGVKYTYQGKTLQVKKKAVSTIELKKTINERRLNKQQYQRVRMMNGSSLEIGSFQADFRETKHKRSQSQAKIKKNKNSIVQKEKIIVSNQNLKEKMLQKVNELMMQTKREDDYENPEKKYQYVGQIDIFNMNYLKNGHQVKNDKKLESLSTERSLMFLPKIEKSNSNKQVFPKQRERIKQINTIIYEIRKKFDEKLKY